MSPALIALLLATQPLAPDTVVVCPNEFHEAIAPWVEYRAGQGHSIELVSNLGTEGEVRERIRSVAKGGRLRFVLLLGDADPRMLLYGGLRRRSVPTHLAQAKVVVQWGSPIHIGTDNYYADLDEDGMPELAVGRLTADTSQELKQMVTKILAYERSADFGPWRRRLNVVAGVGGLGPLADRVIESSTSYFLTNGIPADYDLTMTYANWRSPYCPDPRLFHTTALGRLNEGAWFWIYIGHGYHLGLDFVETPQGYYPILSAADAPMLQCQHGWPIALFLACYTGAFDAVHDCLAEEMLRRPRGPVAVVAGSRVTMPYAMTVLAGALMDECFRRRRATLGEALLHAKQSALKEPAGDDRRRAVLDAVASAISPEPELLAKERAEHVLLFNLLGDPLLRLHHPGQIALDVSPAARAGGPIRVVGQCPIDGPGTMELVVRRDRLTFTPPPRREYPGDPAALAEFQAVYQRANEHRLCVVPFEARDGRFDVQLKVPETASGPCHVRVFVQGQDGFATGAANVAVGPASGRGLLGLLPTGQTTR